MGTYNNNSSCKGTLGSSRESLAEKRHKGTDLAYLSYGRTEIPGSKRKIWYRHAVLFCATRFSLTGFGQIRICPIVDKLVD